MEIQNHILHGYDPKPIRDVHIHCHVQLPVDKTVHIFQNIMSHFNYDKIVLNAIPSKYGYADNEKAFYFKANLKNVFANCGLIHRYNSEDTAEGYLNQVKNLYAMGCDGIKILDGKPQQRAKLKKKLDDPIFNSFYAFAEEKGLPVLMHLGDPPQWWHEETCPQAAKDLGWYYADKSIYVPFENTVKEVEGILTKFPNLKLTLAHFFFMGDNLPYLEEFLGKWENTTVDLTPGGEMFRHFTLNYENSRRFFENHADRILYGTDIYNWEQTTPTIEERYASAVNLVRTFLEKNQEFQHPHATWVTEKPLTPFGFSGDVLDKIYRTNFTKIWGETPRKSDFERIAHSCKTRLETEALSDLDVENLNKVFYFFNKPTEK